MHHGKKLLITGGHITPALAIIDSLKERGINCEIIFVGRQFINDHEHTVTFEYNEVTKRNIPFIHLETGRLTRVASPQTFFSLFKIPTGFARAFAILTKEKPDMILSFGGYIALPIAAAAYVKRIPIYTHEQTIQPGLANQYIAKMAKMVFVSFPDALPFMKNKNGVFTGNPLRKSLFHVTQNLYELPKDVPTMYVTGGSLGAHSVNVHIERILPQLLNHYVVIHQVGNVKQFNDFERLMAFKKTLPEELQKRYIVQQHFSDEEIGWVYSVADLVIGRSGANTCAELIALQKPALFIPLPWSANDEQRKQAALFKQYEVGEIFEQDRPTGELLETIHTMLENKEQYKSHFHALAFLYNPHASDTIIDHLFQT